MEEDREELTPFWLQSTTNLRRTDRIRNSLSSLFCSPGLLIIVLLVTAVSFLVFVVPPTLPLSAQIFRPNTVKKSWDSINVVLVLFALVFGFLSRATNQDRTNDEYQTSPVSRNEIQKSNPSTPQRKWYNYSADEAQKSNLSTFQQQWFGYSDQMANINTGGLRRTSSSYPDLLEVQSEFMSGNDPWRFYDDMTVDTYRVSETGQLLRRRSWKDKFEDARASESKNIYVDTFVKRPTEASNIRRPPSPPTTSSPPPPPLLPPPSPPMSKEKPPSPSMPKEKPKRSYRSVAHKADRRSKRNDNESENKEPISLQVTPPPPPPPPPALPRFVDQKSSKTDNKRSGGSATKDFLNSLYHKKKKKQRQKSRENFNALLHQSQAPPLHFRSPPASSPPPPPPLPPPPSVFHNLFSAKKSKRKRPDQDISASTSSTPKPTLLTPAIHSKPSTSQTITATAHKSLKPMKVRSFDSVEESSNSGGESPLIPIPPPPPPPPPFAKSLSWKFVVQGDYVRVDSSISSRSGSPDTDDVESDSTPTATDGTDATTFPPSPLFFPSPDVNTKAENFISKFRDGLKLEKINSLNKRQGLGLSNLGRGSDSTQF